MSVPNVVNAILSDADRDAVMAAITTIREKLPFLRLHRKTNKAVESFTVVRID